MPVQIDGRGGYDSFALTSRPTGVMLLTRRQPFYPSAAHDKFHSICTAFGGYTEFGIAPLSFLFHAPRNPGAQKAHNAMSLCKCISTNSCLLLFNNAELCRFYNFFAMF